MTLANRSPARRRVLLASDRTDRSADLANILQSAGDVEQIAMSDVPDAPNDNYAGLVIDVDLTSIDNVQLIRRKLTNKAYQSVPRLFVLSDLLHRESTQAWSLGATDTIRWPFDPKAILQRLNGSFPETEAEITAGEILSDGVTAAQNVLIAIFDKLPLGMPLRFDDIVKAEEKILKALRKSTLREWLIAVNKHHMRSFRHSLFVTGYAVAFAQHLCMRDEDQRRLVRAALIHDVGKAFVPLAILDKSDALSAEEEAIFTKHTQLGYDVLQAHGTFPREMLDVVLHHHEFLDGTGYPNKLQGEEISDIVRLITMIDIFAMLTEDGSDTPPMSNAEAFTVMETMTGKIDSQLLQAFRPVAIG